MGARNRFSRLPSTTIIEYLKSAGSPAGLQLDVMQKEKTSKWDWVAPDGRRATPDELKLLPVQDRVPLRPSK